MFNPFETNVLFQYPLKMFLSFSGGGMEIELCEMALILSKLDYDSIHSF